MGSLGKWLVEGAVLETQILVVCKWGIHTKSSFAIAESTGSLPTAHGSNCPASIHGQTDLLNYLPAGSHFFYNKQRSER